jgi:hypothetical protein
MVIDNAAVTDAVLYSSTVAIIEVRPEPVKADTACLLTPALSRLFLFFPQFGENRQILEGRHITADFVP